MSLTRSVYHSGGEYTEAHRVSESVGCAQEQGRVRLVLGLIQGAIGDNLRDIIWHACPVERRDDRNWHVLSEQDVLDCIQALIKDTEQQRQRYSQYMIGAMIQQTMTKVA